MTKQAAGSRQPREGGASLLWLQGLLCGGLLAIRPGLALAVVALFWPVGLALVIDRSPGRALLRCIALCALAGSLGPLLATWKDPSQLAQALDARTLGTAWCAAALGWLLYEFAPLGVRAATNLLDATRAARLKAERAQLAREFLPGERAQP